MNIDEALVVIADLIRSASGLDVRVARPNETVTGLVVWPWRVSDVSGLQNIPPGRRATAVDTRQPAIVEVSFVLMASPAGYEAQAGNVLLAHRVLLDNPVINASGGNVRIAVQLLSVEELAAVFLAAQVPLSFCTNYSLQLAL